MVYNYRESSRESERERGVWVFIYFCGFSEFGRLKVETFRFFFFFQLERESKSGAKRKAYEGIFLFFVLCMVLREG